MKTKLILTAVFSISLFMFPAKSFGAVTNIEEKVLETLKVENGDIRAEWLSWLRLKSELTDDEFSDILVRTADIPEVRKEPWLRGFTLRAVMDFGTTNALEFLKNEVASGPDFAGGLTGYSIITGFDDRCFTLLQKIVEDESDGNYRRRFDVYSLLDYVLTPGADHIVRCVNSNDLANVRQRVLSFLLDATQKEKKYNRVYLDQILIERLPEYRRSEERRAIIRELKDSEVPTPYVGDYFRNELQKLEAEEARARDAAATPGADAPPLADKPSRMWRKSPAVAFGALVIGITCVAVRRRRKK